MKKTSDVPLKKETVRVTLKATDDSQKAAPAPSAPQPPAPAPTIPLRAANPSAPAPKVAAPAPTVQLKTPGAATAPKTTPLKTQPLSTPGDGGTQALPKATVQLGSATQALGAPTALSAAGATIQTAVEEETETDPVAGYLSMVAFLFALAVLGLQLSTAGKWVDEDEPVNGAGWNALFE